MRPRIERRLSRTLVSMGLNRAPPGISARMAPPPGPAQLDLIAENRQNPLVVPWLFDILEQTDLVDGFDRILFVRVAGQHHAAQGRMRKKPLGMLAAAE